MKKLAMAIVMVLICVSVWAADPDKIVYDLWRNAYYVVGYDGIAEGELVIPAEYNGKPVLGISSQAFLEHKLTSLIISEGITTISGQAFYGNQLTNVSFPDSLVSIGASAFINNNLTDVVFPRHVRYEKHPNWAVAAFDIDVTVIYRD